MQQSILIFYLFLPFQFTFIFLFLLECSTHIYASDFISTSDILSYLSVTCQYLCYFMESLFQEAMVGEFSSEGEKNCWPAEALHRIGCLKEKFTHVGYVV